MPEILATEPVFPYEMLSDTFLIAKSLIILVSRTVPQIPSITRIYASQQPRLIRLVMRVVGNRATSEELVQEAFLRLIANEDTEEIRSHEAYLTRVSRNLALNHLRHIRMGVEISVDSAVLEALGEENPAVDDILIARQQLKIVLKAIIALPPRRREVFILHRFEGLTYDQIAKRLIISRNTVMVQIVNALVDLRNALD